jgi:hypothetical protein
MMFTVLTMEGKIPKRAIGCFKTIEEAESWAINDGWKKEQFKIIRLDL